MPKVSVLMPAYNVKEEYLRKAVESILNQTFKDFEFIILDDCSDRDIAPIIQSYNDNRIRFYRNEKNLGIAASRNKLMDLANGEYAAVMDSDDISLPERLEKQVAYMDSHPEVSVLSTGYEAFPKREVAVHPENVTYLDLLQCCRVTHPAAMLRISDFRKYDLKYDSQYECSQDYDLWSRAIRYVKIANLPEVLLKYRVEGQNITQRKRDVLFSDTRKVQNNMLNFLTSDKKLQDQIRMMLKLPDRPLTFWQKIFSVYNKNSQKLLVIFGKSFVLCKLDK